MKKKKEKRAQKSDPPQPVPAGSTLADSISDAFERLDAGLSPVLKKILISIMLVLLIGGVVSNKLYLLNKLPHFDPKNGHGFFWTESAFHYRHFLMIAQGEAIPAVDYGIQYPEGLDTLRYITPVMEYAAGIIYRLGFSNMPPHLFVVYFNIFFSTLSVLAIFLAGKAAWRSNTIAFLVAVIYGFALASLARSAAGGFIREDFALPFIFFSFACFLDCLQKDRPLVSALGSMLFVIALSAWHVTQLYLSLFAAALTVIYLFGPTKDLPRRSILVFVGFMLAASLLIPVLRAKFFVVSPALMLLYALVALFLRFPADSLPTRNKAVAGLVILVFLIGSLVIQHYLGTYSHVYALVFNKLKFLGVMPQDSGRLPFEAKAMWTSAFVSPKLIELPIMLASSVIFGPIGAGIIFFRWFKKQAGNAELMITLLAGWLSILFLMIHRMSVFAVFFLALSVGALTCVKKKQLKYTLYAGLGAFLLAQIYWQPMLRAHAFRPSQNDLNNLLSFIEEQTAADEAVLTAFELGPSVAAYTGRPVILHSKFESKLLREKVKQVYTTFYQSEQQFFELCRRFKAGLFAYQVNMVLNGAPGSLRYLTNAIPLKTGSAAFKFHFFPDRLNHFNLIYQNSSYRLYRIAAPTPSAVSSLQYEPVYDFTIYSAEESPDNFIDEELIKKGLENLRYPEMHLKIGDRLFASEDYPTAAGRYQVALRLNPGNKRAAWSLARALILAGEAEKSKDVLQLAVALDPDYDVAAIDISEANALMLLGREALNRKQFGKAEILFQRALEDQPDAEAAYFGLGPAGRQ